MRVASLLALAIGGSAAPVLNKRISVTETDLSNFKFFAQYSTAAYCNSGAAAGAKITCSDSSCPTVQAHGATVLASFAGASTDQEGFVAVDTVTSQIIISFRGSHGLANWITDLNFGFTSCDFVTDCKIHTGFRDAWSEVSSAVKAALATAVAAHPSFKIITTGHSLGGAVATLAAADLRRTGYAVDIYSFGSPRVGNDKFADFVTAQTGAEYRVTHVNDLVPRLPPIILGFRHTSPEYWLSDMDDTSVNYAVSDIKVCTGNANTDCNGSSLLFSTTAHNYYLLEMGSCEASTSKRELLGSVADQELNDQLNEWAEQDRQYAAELAQTGTATS